VKNKNLKALLIILNAGFAESVVEVARSAGVVGATIINARGAGTPKSFMGITIDTEKEIILSVINEDIETAVMSAIKEKAGITTPAHCICFTMPVDKAVGLSASTENKK